MALVKPLILKAGKLEQLQSTDTIEALSTANIYSMTNDSGGALVIGAPVYNNDTGSVSKARANTAITSEVIGLAFDVSTANGATGQIITSGVIEATTLEWAAIAAVDGLIAYGVEYFLSEAGAGLIVSTPHTSGWVVPIGRGLSGTLMLVNIQRPIKL